MDNLGQSDSPYSQTDFQLAAAVACLDQHGDHDPVILSLEISKYLGRSILVVNLADLPHAPTDVGRFVKFDEAQLEKRAAALHQLADAAFPGQKPFWNTWQWDKTAEMSTASSDYNKFDADIPAIPTRLTGTVWSGAAVITLPDRRIKPEAFWQDLTTLDASENARYPYSDGVLLYDLGHELSHTTQLRSPELCREEQWMTEVDADRGSFAALEILDQDGLRNFHEVKSAIVHTRALGAFRKTYRNYWSALALDGNADVTLENSVRAGYEVRFRTYSELTGFPIPQSSEALQKIIPECIAKKCTSTDKTVRELNRVFGSKFDWVDYYRLDQAIPALRRVMQSGSMTDPLARRNAELIVAAAEYFRPDLKQTTVMQVAQPVRQDNWVGGLSQPFLQPVNA